jgi:hypothetical protein
VRLDGSDRVQKPYLDAQRMYDEPMDWGHRSYMKSALLPSLTDELLDLAVEHRMRIPEGGDGAMSIWPIGRAISSVPEEATFSGREAASGSPPRCSGTTPRSTTAAVSRRVA